MCCKDEPSAAGTAEAPARPLTEHRLCPAPLPPRVPQHGDGWAVRRVGAWLDGAAPVVSEQR